MNDDPVPDSDHISRYCGFDTLAPGGRITGTAFRLREKSDEKSLSVNWLELLGLEDRESAIEEIRRVFDQKFTLGKQAKFAVLNVGEMREHVLNGSPDGRVLSVLHEPKNYDPSHSEIHGLNFEDDLISVLIADKVKEDYPAIV